MKYRPVLTSVLFVEGSSSRRVAVARKLAVLLHRMWIDGTEFRQEIVEGMT